MNEVAYIMNAGEYVGFFSQTISNRANPKPLVIEAAEKAEASFNAIGAPEEFLLGTKAISEDFDASVATQAPNPNPSLEETAVVTPIRHNITPGKKGRLDYDGPR